MPDAGTPVKSGARGPSLRALRIHFFLTYAVLGGMLPFFPVYLKEVRHLTPTQIGIVLGVAATSVLVTPVLFTWMADTRRNTRLLATIIYLTSALAVTGLLLTSGFWATLILFGLYSLAFAPMLPLQDGLYFSVAKDRADRGEETPPFHRIRVWGTIGFIFPSPILFAFLHQGHSLNLTLVSSIALCGLGVINSRFLPEPRSEPRPGQARGGLPTMAAARVLFRYPTILFCLAMALTQFAAAGYYGFYPLYLTEVVAIGPEWLGLISNIGVTVEVFFMLGFGWLSLNLGVRRIMILGALAMSIRMASLAFLPLPAIAIAVQFFHGLIIMATIVAPVVYLNRLAGDRFRNSIQGLYTMLITGLARIAGNLTFGHVAEQDLINVFRIGMILTLIASGLFALALRKPPEQNA